MLLMNFEEVEEIVNWFDCFVLSSFGSVVDVFSIINWLTILVSLLSTTSAKKPPRIWVSIKFDKSLNQFCSFFLSDMLFYA